MTREEVYEQLNEVFRDVFDDDSITDLVKGAYGGADLSSLE